MFCFIINHKVYIEVQMLTTNLYKLLGLLTKDDSAMPIGLKVHPDVVLQGLVVQMLDAGGSTGHGHAQLVHDIVGGASVGVGSLYKTQPGSKEQLLVSENY